MPVHAWFLAGPTAVGKTAVAHLLAARLRATLLSADSMQVYRGMDIGTAKPTPAERAGLTYWGLDLVDPDQPFSTGEYLRALGEQRARDPAAAARVVVVGGTGLYLRALALGLDGRPAPDPAERARLEQLLQTGGRAALQAELERRAPGRLATLADPQNPRRLIRAIELAGLEGTGSSMAPRPTAPLRLCGLAMDPPALTARIETRVAAMYENGLLEEAASLLRRYPEISPTARQAIGYAEAWAVGAGTMTPAEARAATARRTRQLAKRQLTWLRHQAATTWIEVRAGDSVADIADRVQTQWESDGPIPLHI